MSRLLLAALLLALPATAISQAHPLVGQWDVMVPAGMRVENGEPTPIMAKGRFAFTQVGDSIIGTLHNEPIEGQPARPATRIAAKVAAGTITFTSQSEAKLRMNEEESTRTVHVTYVFDVTGDALKGTVERRIEGLNMPMGGAQPITGTRAKG